MNAPARMLSSSTILTAAAALALALPMALQPASASPTRLALSEIQQEPAPAADDPAAPAPEMPRAAPGGVPMPDPVLRLPLPDAPAVAPRPGLEEPAAEDPEAYPGDAEGQEPGDEAAEPLPEVQYDYSLLPPDVQRMRELIMEACRTGDPERLRPLLGLGDGATQLSFGDVGDDPISYLVEISGDDRGQEILAILLEILDAGYVHLAAGTPGEIYVFPYFFGIPLGQLTDPQRVELFKIVTAGDVEEMKIYGAYTFYRAGFAPDGRWLFFVAGD